MTEPITLPELPKEQPAQEQTAMSIVDQAKNFPIETVEDLEAGRDFIRQLNARIKFAREHHKPMKETAKAAHTAACDAEKRVVDPLTQAKDILTSSANVFLQNQERLAQIERQKESERLEREKQARLEKARKKVEKLLGKTKNDVERLEQVRAQLADTRTSEEEAYILNTEVGLLESRISGQQNNAAEVQYGAEAHADMAAPATPATAPAQVKGVVGRKYTTVTVLRPTELLNAIISGVIPVSIVQFDQKALVKLADAGMNIPGCTVKTETKHHIR